MSCHSREGWVYSTGIRDEAYRRFLDLLNMICVCNFNLPDHNYAFIDKNNQIYTTFCFLQIGCKSE